MKQLFTLFAIGFCLAGNAQNVGVGTTTPQTTLDVKGGMRIQPLYLTGSGTNITIPDNESNINLAGTFTGPFAATISNPKDGQRLTIDNNSNHVGSLVAGGEIKKGLNEFVHSDGEWKVVNNNSWSLDGNYYSNPATQFLGTTDENDFVVKRNNIEKLRLVNEGLQISETNTLEFGAGITGKPVDNGKIGYNTFGEANTLSIVGGGVSPAGLDRRIKMWADLGTEFTGGATFNKNVQIKNNTFSMLSFITTTALAPGPMNIINFGGTNYSTGLITITGTSSSAARMGFSTGYSFAGGVGNMTERLSISNNGNVGVNQINPVARLDVLGKIKIADDGNTAVAGNVRWNALIKDFEGYDGSKWLSLTRSKSDGWGGNSTLTENTSFEAAGTNDNMERKFGTSIAFNGNQAVIGTDFYYNSSGGGTDLIGKVFLFNFNPNTEEWTEGITIVPSDGMPGDGFGRSVAWNAGYIVVGAPTATVNSPGGLKVWGGKVYIFNSSGTELFKIEGEAREDNFGSSVAINSTGHLIVGAPGYGVSAPPQNNGQGKVYSYFVQATGPQLINQFTDPSGASNNHFGTTVNITDDRFAFITDATGKVVIFSYFSNAGTYLYQFISNLSFSESGANVYSIKFDLNYGGTGNFIIRGTGKAFVFYKTGGTFTEVQIIRASNANDIISASIKADFAVLSSSTRVDVFKKYGNTWSQQTTLQPSVATNSFGSDVNFFQDKYILITARLANSSKGDIHV